MRLSRIMWLFLLLLFTMGIPSGAQMVSGDKMPGWAETLGLDPTGHPPAFAAQFVGSTAPGNVLWPGDAAQFTIQIRNTSAEALALTGRVEVIRCGTRGIPNDIWKPLMVRIADEGGVPLVVNLVPKAFTNAVVKPVVPDTLGGYALVVDLGSGGRRYVTSFVRTFRAESKPVQYPQFCLDVTDIDVLKRLGAAPNRIALSYKPTTNADFEKFFETQGAILQAYKDAGLAITLEIGGGDFFGPTQPLGRPRPHLDDHDTMKDTKFDLAWLPAYDADFRLFVKRFVSAYGWPKGPVNGIKLWNEPWEGMSIAGWGADMLRYREIFTAMAEATEEARKDAGVEVLIGGCDSDSNTLDKLFSDGKDTFLKWLDFCSIHYQGMAPPSTIKAWVNRKHPNGRVRIWDTESWVANSDDRVAAVVAANLSSGHDRAVGVFHGNICAAGGRQGWVDYTGDDGKKARARVTQAYPVAAAVGAVTHFIGERKFRELLFHDGLPWIMVFDGRSGPDGRPDPEDGTVVVVGDLGEEFGADNLLFRTARGFAEHAHKAEMRKQLATLAADAPERGDLEKALRKPETLSGATMTLAAAGGKFGLFDFYGNPVAAEDGKIPVPLDGRGFFLRGDGKPGSYAAMLDALRAARIEGIEPLAKSCHDLLKPIEEKPDLRLTLQNVLNRPVRGRLTVSLGALTLVPAEQDVTFAAHETKDVTIRVAGGAPVVNNTYPLQLSFDAGVDGRSTHEEDLHVNAIARRTIVVDGNLDDWKGALPQPIIGDGSGGPTLTEAAWLPFVKFDTSVEKGFATAWLACDDTCFYFAARIADNTPDEGTLRFETRDDDAFFYPATSFVKRVEKAGVAPSLKGDTTEPTALVWPEGVRRYSYRMRPPLPAGTAPPFDNVQLAFNVLPPEAKPRYPCPPGTMPGYIGYSDTDYEFALNTVAPKYGGGVEVWRLRAPDLPHKHYYPREPKAPGEGPVKDAKLVTRRDGNTRIVECALPWSAIPEAKQRLDAGQTIKFSYRVNDNSNNACMELSRQRSLAKRNTSFLCDWGEHWANELEFAR